MPFSVRAQSPISGVTPAHEWSTITAGTRPLPAGKERSPVTEAGCSMAPGRVGDVSGRMGDVPVRPAARLAVRTDEAAPGTQAKQTWMQVGFERPASARSIAGSA